MRPKDSPLKPLLFHYFFSKRPFAAGCRGRLRNLLLGPHPGDSWLSDLHPRIQAFTPAGGGLPILHYPTYFFADKTKI